MTTPLLLPILLLHALVPAEPSFVRVETRDTGRVLRTSVIDYVHPSGARVTLVATVHLADRAYYDAIRRRLASADAVVHEGVQRRLTRPLLPASTPPDGLVSQSEELRCRGERFVVGDLDEVAFDALREPGVRIAPAPADRASLAASVIAALADAETRLRTERAFAILPRNAAAMTALKHRLARGDQHIILLYGASHAPDLDQRLLTDLGFARAETTWLDVFEY